MSLVEVEPDVAKFHALVDIHQCPGLSSYFFFQLNVTTWFLQDTFFRHFEVFAKNNIVMLRSRICLFIDKKEGY